MDDSIYMRPRIVVHRNPGTLPCWQSIDNSFPPYTSATLHSTGPRTRCSWCTSWSEGAMASSEHPAVNKNAPRAAPADEEESQPSVGGPRCISPLKIKTTRLYKKVNNERPFSLDSIRERLMQGPASMSDILQASIDSRDMSAVAPRTHQREAGGREEGETVPIIR